MSNSKSHYKGPGPDPNDLSRFLAERAAIMTYRDLTPADVDAAKRSILDTIGVSLAATSKAPKAVDPTRAYLASYGSSGPVPCLTLGTRVHVLDAVFWLGAISHALDFDDVAGYCHPSASVIAATLPLLTLRPLTDGRTLLVATALGQDLVVRIAQSLHRPVNDHGWLHSLPGIFGSAIAASKVLNLDAQQIRNCLGLSLHQTAGTLQALARPGSDFRGIREGFSARAGVISAFLASTGMAGDPESMEGEFGLFQQFCKGEYDAQFVRQPHLLGSRITYKPWPCAGHPQLFLTVLHELLSRHAVDPDDIKEIRITGCSALLPHQCEPLEQRAAPPHGIDAKVSLPFLIGKIVCRRGLAIDDFSGPGLRDAESIAVARRVKWTLDPSLERGVNGYGMGIVEVGLRDGRTLQHQAEHPLGHPSNPLPWDQLVTKFRQCADASAVPISRSAIDCVVDLIANLESLPSADVIIETLVRGMELPDQTQS